MDHPLRAVIVAFAEMVMANLALGIDKVVRRPILVVEGPPDRVVIVERNGITDLEIGNGVAHVVDILLEGEFGRVHPDHHEALVFVLLGPGSHIGNGAQAVDAGVCPEIHQDDLALERICGERRGVQPFDGA